MVTSFMEIIRNISYCFIIKTDSYYKYYFTLDFLYINSQLFPLFSTAVIKLFILSYIYFNFTANTSYSSKFKGTS